MKITSSNINFTSRTNLDLSSIKEQMPSQEFSILGAVMYLSHNGENNDVFIKALSPDVMELKVIDADKNTKTTNVVDARKMVAMEFYNQGIDICRRSGEEITPEVQRELSKGFQSLIYAINKTPYDFGHALLTQYDKLVKKEV